MSEPVTVIGSPVSPYVRKVLALLELKRCRTGSTRSHRSWATTTSPGSARCGASRC